MRNVTLLLPYMRNCVEVWENTYRTNTQTISLIQKKAIRLINNAEYGDHTNVLFIKTQAIKLQDLTFKTVQIYKARNKIRPKEICKLQKPGS